MYISKVAQIWPVCNKGVTQFYLPPTHEPVLSKVDDFANVKKVEVQAKNSTF